MHEFNIGGHIVVVTEFGSDYAVSIDGKVVGSIYEEATPNGVYWSTSANISDELVREIGSRIEKERNGL